MRMINILFLDLTKMAIAAPGDTSVNQTSSAAGHAPAVHGPRTRVAVAGATGYAGRNWCGARPSPGGHADGSDVVRRHERTPGAARRLRASGTKP